MRFAVGLVCVAVAGLGSTVTSGVQAGSLRDDREQLVAWAKQEGASVRASGSLFMFEDDLRWIAAGDPPGSADGCTRFVALTDRRVGVSVSAVAAASLRRAATVPFPKIDGESELGVLELTRCGSGRSELSHLGLSLLGPRGSVEWLVLDSEAPLPPLSVGLPGRAPGPASERGDQGPPLPPPALSLRRAVAERNARDRHAVSSTWSRIGASEEGRGVFSVDVQPGCYAFDVLSDAEGGVDVDAELVDPEGPVTLDADRSDAPDAHVSACFVEAQPVRLHFRGAAPNRLVFLLASRADLDPGIVMSFGGRPARSWATSRFRRPGPTLDAPPVFLGLGAGGRTTVQLPLPAARCYLAGVAIASGQATFASVAVGDGIDTSSHEVNGGDEAPSAAFCVHRDRPVTAVVMAQGGSPTWVLAVWDVGPIAEAP